MDLEWLWKLVLLQGGLAMGSSKTNLLESRRSIEWALLLAFMMLASSILVRAGETSNHTILRSLLWLAAGDAVYLFWKKRRKKQVQMTRC